MVLNCLSSTMRKALVIAVCLQIATLASGSARNSPRPDKGRQAEGARKRNEVPREDYLPYWDPQPKVSKQGIIAVNQSVVPRQFYPGQGGASPAIDASDSFVGSNNEIPRPIPPRPDVSNPRPPRPPRPPGCLEERGQFASTRSCAHYLNCWDGNVVEQQCPHDLLFNEHMSYCDYDYNVDCAGRPEFPKPSLPQGIKRCPDPNGRYRSALNCSEFYICLSGSPIKFSCPEGLVYNEQIHVCDFLEKVDCRGSATPKPLPVEEVPEPEFYPDYPEQIGFPPQPGISVDPIIPIQPGYPGQGGSSGYPSFPSPPQQIGYPGISGQGGASAGISSQIQPGGSGQPGLPSQGGIPSRPGHPNRPGQHPLHTTYRPPPAQPHPTRPPRPAHHRPPHRPITSSTTQQPTFPTQPQLGYPTTSPQLGYPDPNPNPPYPQGGNDFPAPSPYSSRWSTRTKTNQWQERNTQVKDEPEQEVQPPKEPENGTESAEEGEITEETATTTIINPWSVNHTIPEELNKEPCNDGDVHRLDESCTSVVLCKNKKPVLLKCQTGYTYDKPTDSCRPFTLAKC